VLQQMMFLVITFLRCTVILKESEKFFTTIFNFFTKYLFFNKNRKLGPWRAFQKAGRAWPNG
jgi:hypothetical protein